MGDHRFNHSLLSGLSNHSLLVDWSFRRLYNDFCVLCIWNCTADVLLLLRECPGSFHGQGSAFEGNQPRCYWLKPNWLGFLENQPLQRESTAYRFQFTTVCKIPTGTPHVCMGKV